MLYNYNKLGKHTHTIISVGIGRSKLKHHMCQHCKFQLHFESCLYKKAKISYLKKHRNEYWWWWNIFLWCDRCNYFDCKATWLEFLKHLCMSMKTSLAINVILRQDDWTTWRTIWKPKMKSIEWLCSTVFIMYCFLFLLLLL